MCPFVFFDPELIFENMKKIACLFIVLSLFSCVEKKEILLPKSDVTLVKEVSDLSRIDFIFYIENNDTLASVRKNTVITTTNWVFNIDKRLPLSVVIPEVRKLQKKKLKRKSDEDAPKDNFYAYADTVRRNLAFIPFTNISYKLEKPKAGMIVFFRKDNQIFVNDKKVERADLQQYINDTNKLFEEVNFCFDKNSSFEFYIQNEIFIKTLRLKRTEEDEFVY